MPCSTKQYKCILVFLCEVTNFLQALPLKTTQTLDVCAANGYIKYIGSPTHIICDQSPAFMSSILQYFFHTFGIKILTVSVTNYKCLLGEHGIKVCQTF